MGAIFDASTAAHAHRKVRELGSLAKLKQDPLGSEALRELRRQMFLAEFLVSKSPITGLSVGAHKTITAFISLSHQLVVQLFRVEK